MNDFLAALLVHPNTKQPLYYDASANILKEGNGDGVFHILSNVPLLLPVTTDNDALFNYQEHYEQDAKSFDYFEDFIDAHQVENDRLHEHILSEIPDHAALILDVGCGGAWLSKQMLPKGKTVISMDISTTNPVRALQMYPSENHYAIVADVFSLPIRPNAIDCIVASEIIEHVKDPALFIEQLTAVLKPGGKLVITTPHNEVILQSLCIHCNSLTPQNAHLHSFTQDKIKSLVKNDIGKVETRIFNSKLLLFFRLHEKLRNVSFRLWRVIDKLAIRISGKKAARLMLTVIKK